MFSKTYKTFKLSMFLLTENYENILNLTVENVFGFYLSQKSQPLLKRATSYSMLFLVFVNMRIFANV